MVQVEGAFASVERIVEFSKGLELEPAYRRPQVDDRLEREQWPDATKVVGLSG